MESLIVKQCLQTQEDASKKHTTMCDQLLWSNLGLGMQPD